MPAVAPILFAAPLLLGAGLAMWIVALLIARRHRINLRPMTAAILATGFLLLALAAGDPGWQWARHDPVTVMVDLSPSTRGASFRSRAWLEHRVAQLLGDRPRRYLAFADISSPLPAGNTFADIPADRTRLAAPADASAILLLSDGRFPLPPPSPPIYPVIDPALDSAPDAAVTQLEIHNSQAIASVSNDGPPRQLTWSGGDSSPSSTWVAASQQVAAPAGSPGETVARLSPGDRWPENDSLSILPPPPADLQHWWVGRRDPGLGWTAFSAAALPTDPQDYLNAAVVVIDNVSPAAFTVQQLSNLDRFVRDFGGGLVIVGGADAFGSALASTPLDRLSPLAPTPPQPTARWIVLIDASGSMASPAGTADSTQTLWQAETAAARAVLPTLPPADRVSAGGFSGSVQWWWTDVPAADAADVAAHPCPPADAGPHGPTDLAAALQQSADLADAALPTQLLLMTDADAPLPHPDALAASLAARRIRLHVLALANGQALNALRQIASATGGAVLQQIEPTQWLASARQLARQAWPDLLRREPAQVRFVGPLAGWPDRPAALPWNRTWLRIGATLAGTMNTSTDAATPPAAALWHVGSGQVAALAFAADPSLCDRLARRVSASPRDPRFTVTCKLGPQLRITVDAIDAGKSLNDLAAAVLLQDLQPGSATQEVIPLPQTGPGRYAATLPPPRRPVVASVSIGGRVIERLALAGRYPEEFDAVGNDRATLQLLARRSGGRVIDPAERGPVELASPTRELPLLPWLAIIGAALIAAGALRAKSGK